MRQNINERTTSRLYVQSCSGAETANYRQRREAGEYLPPLHYSLNIFSQSGPVQQTTLEVFRGNVINCYSSSDTMVDNHPLRSTSSAFFSNGIMKEVTTRRRNKLLSKIQGQSLPLLMMYKERKETQSLILSFLEDAIFCAKHIRNPRAILRRYGWKGNLPPGKTIKRLRAIASKGTQSIGNVWLQYRFAWSPLLADIAASLDAAVNAEKKGIMLKKRVGEEFESTFVRSKYNQDGVTGATGSVRRKGYYGLWCSYLITDASLAALAQIQNAEFTLWDSVPYSFIIDRVVNIGQWLDLRYATAGVVHDGGCETTFYKDTFHVAEKEIYSSRGESLSSVGVYGFVVSRHGPARVDVFMNRVVLNSFPRPALEYPYKEFFGSTSRIMDCASLIRQRFKLKT